ncbi:MAG: hypothetical protein ACREUC_17215, partial [Steroidobacteraceae bacterium]
MSVRRVFALLAGVLASASLHAQSIDYDPRRASELRPCDEHRYHGRAEQARSCYSQFLNSPNAVVLAESAWAL